MKNVKILFLLAFVFTAFQVVAMSSPSYAVVKKVVKPKVVAKPKTPAKPVVDAVPAGPPTATLSYNISTHRFSVRVTNVKKITYVIAYNKRGGSIMEALQGARKYTKATNFTATLYAGSQSSKYFIPHTVTSGIMDIKGTDGQNNSFSIHKTFTVSGKKFVVPN